MSNFSEEYGSEMTTEIYIVESPPRANKRKCKTRNMVVLADDIDQVSEPQKVLSLGGVIDYDQVPPQLAPGQVKYKIHSWTSINSPTRQGDGIAYDSASPTLEASSGPTSEVSLSLASEVPLQAELKRTYKTAMSKKHARHASYPPPPAKRQRTALPSSPLNQQAVAPLSLIGRPVGRRTPWNDLEQALFMREYWTTESWKKMSDAMNSFVLKNNLEGTRVFNYNMVYKQSRDHINDWLPYWGYGPKAEDFVNAQIALSSPVRVGGGGSSSSDGHKMGSNFMDGVEYDASSISPSPIPAPQVNKPQPIREQISETRFAITTVMGARHEFDIEGN